MIVEGIIIGLRTHSDHVPILVQWRMKYDKGQGWAWRLDNYLLLNQETKGKVQEELDIFFQANHLTEDKTLLWETFKAIYQRNIDWSNICICI